MHYDTPFEHVEVIQLYGRKPKPPELAQFAKHFPNATVETCGDPKKGPKLVARAKSSTNKPATKPAKKR